FATHFRMSLGARPLVWPRKANEDAHTRSRALAHIPAKWTPVRRQEYAPTKMRLAIGRMPHENRTFAGPRRRRRRRIGIRDARAGAGVQAHLRGSELADRLGAGACALSLGQAGRGGDQGAREGRGLSVADPD